jgi:hypothetical protein
MNGIEYNFKKFTVLYEGVVECSCARERGDLKKKNTKHKKYYH